jgi:hypothetical protein
MLLLVSGKFRLDLSVGSVTLEKQGDYVVWGPGIDHSWQAEEDSVVVTVRWPSVVCHGILRVRPPEANGCLAPESSGTGSGLPVRRCACSAVLAVGWDTAISEVPGTRVTRSRWRPGGDTEASGALGAVGRAGC